MQTLIPAELILQVKVKNVEQGLFSNLTNLAQTAASIGQTAAQTAAQRAANYASQAPAWSGAGAF